MRGLLIVSALSLAAGAMFPPASFTQDSMFDYSSYSRVLERIVSEQGTVHYRRLTAESSDLEAFVSQIGSFSPESHPDIFPDRHHQLAYWINAYNALVLSKVAERYPVGSIRDISFLFGFFWRLKHTAGGQRYTLNHIEHEIIRKRYRDPRIHFALNCASTSCPKLAARPYLPESLDEQLDAAAREFINDISHVRPEPERSRIHISKIFDWYENDFKDHMRDRLRTPDSSVLDYLKLYGSPELIGFIEIERPRIRHMDYDWALNDASDEAGTVFEDTR